MVLSTESIKGGRVAAFLHIQVHHIARTPSMMAAISAAIAEDMGTDVSAIRIVSIKKV